MRTIVTMLLLIPLAHAADVTTLRVPDSGIQPQIAVDSSGAVHLLFFKGKAGAGDLYYARLGKDGRFGKSIRVNSQPGSAIAIGNVRGAHIATGKGGRIHVAWMGSKPSKPRAQDDAAPMLYTRLAAKRDAFEPQRNLLQAATGLDGGGSIAADSKGNVFVAWHAGTPQAGEAGRRIWIARSTNDGKTFARERPAIAQNTGACACCGMRGFVDANDNVMMLYRGCIKTVNRDMFLLFSKDGGRRYQGKRVDGWKVARCVMSTAHMVADGKRGILAAWETRGQVKFARFDPARAKLSPSIGAPGASKGRKHPVLATNKRGQTILVWTEGMGWNRGGSLHWQVYDKTGKPLGAVGTKPGVPVWSLVAAYARPDGSFEIIY